MFHKEYYSYLPVADNLDDEATKAILPVFEKYVDKGYSPREVSQIIQIAVGMIECQVILDTNNNNN